MAGRKKASSSSKRVEEKWNEAKLEALARRDLQALAKKHGVKANMKSEDIRSELLQILAPNNTNNSSDDHDASEDDNEEEEEEEEEIKKVSSKQPSKSKGNNKKVVVAPTKSAKVSKAVATKKDDSDDEEEQEEEMDEEEEESSEESETEEADEPAKAVEKKKTAEKKQSAHVTVAAVQTTGKRVAAPTSPFVVVEKKQKSEEKASSKTPSKESSVRIVVVPSSPPSNSLSTSTTIAGRLSSPATPIIAVLPPTPLPTPMPTISLTDTNNGIGSSSTLSVPTIAVALSLSSPVRPSSPPRSSVNSDRKSPVSERSSPSLSLSLSTSSSPMTAEPSPSSMNESLADRRRSRMSIGGISSSARRKWSISTMSLMTTTGSVTIAVPTNDNINTSDPDILASTPSSLLLPSTVSDNVDIVTTVTTVVASTEPSLPLAASTTSSSSSSSTPSTNRWRSRSMGAPLASSLLSLSEEMNELSREVEAMKRTPGRRRTIATATPSRIITGNVYHLFAPLFHVLSLLYVAMCVDDQDRPSSDSNIDNTESNIAKLAASLSSSPVRGAEVSNQETTLVNDTNKVAPLIMDETNDAPLSSSLSSPPTIMAPVDGDTEAVATLESTTAVSRRSGVGMTPSREQRNRRRSSFGHMLVPRSPPQQRPLQENVAPLEPLIPTQPRRSLARASISGASSLLPAPVVSSSSSSSSLTRNTPKKPVFDIKSSLAKPPSWQMKKGMTYCNNTPSPFLTWIL
jgi:hypothetical protein